MNKKQRNTAPKPFQVKIALDGIIGQRTINEIASHYRIHPNLVAQWKR